MAFGSSYPGRKGCPLVPTGTSNACLDFTKPLDAETAEIMRSLEYAWIRSRAQNRPWPEEKLGSRRACSLLLRIWLQHDNTVKEVRNSYGHRTLAHLVQAGLWKAGGAHCLRVGHTHEDVDAVFALAATALRSTPNGLETPADIQRRLHERLSHLFTSKNMAFGVEIVDSVT